MLETTCGFKSRRSHHIFCLGIGLTKPIPRFCFALKPPSVHCLSIIRSSCPLRSGASPFLAREVEYRCNSVTRSGLCLLEHMTVYGSRIQPLKRAHNSKIFWDRSVKRFLSFCLLPRTSCAVTAFRAACSRCEFRVVCLWYTRQRLCTR